MHFQTTTKTSDLAFTLAVTSVEFKLLSKSPSEITKQIAMNSTVIIIASDACIICGPVQHSN